MACGISVVHLPRRSCTTCTTTKRGFCISACASGGHSHDRPRPAPTDRAASSISERTEAEQQPAPSPILPAQPASSPPTVVGNPVGTPSRWRPAHRVGRRRRSSAIAAGARSILTSTPTAITTQRGKPNPSERLAPMPSDTIDAQRYLNGVSELGYPAGSQSCNDARGRRPSSQVLNPRPRSQVRRVLQ